MLAGWSAEYCSRTTSLPSPADLIDRILPGGEAKQEPTVEAGPEALARIFRELSGSAAEAPAR